MNEIINKIKIILKDLLTYKRSVIIILAPVLFLPIILQENSDSASKCAYTVLIMAAYWVTEAAPLAVTAFIPIFMFPFLGVMTVGRTCGNYLKDVNFLFVGGLIMAVATEESNLHKRIALRVLITMGSEPRWLMCGFMLTTAFLSMWMSNTASTAMMLPIAAAVLEELIKCYLAADNEELNNKLEVNVGQEMMPNSADDEKYDHLTVESDGKVLTLEELIEEEENFPELMHNAREFVTDVGVQTDLEIELAEKNINSDNADEPATIVNKIPEFHHLPKSIQGICKSILLSICISANLGGTGTLTGTGPNLVFIGQLVLFFPTQTDITFASWLAFGVPSMLLCLILAWIWLQIFFTGFKTTFACFFNRNQPKQKNNAVSKMLRMKYEELGKITFAELSVLFWFGVLVFLWIFREPMFIPGWNKWFNMKKGFTSDSCAAMMIACLLFVWPNYPPDFMCLRKDPNSKPIKRTSLMTWHAMQQKFPWSVIILLGGGFAMADGVQQSGLAIWLSCGMQNALKHLNPSAIIFIFVCLITGITEVASNSATASIFIPILLSVSQALHVNPLYMGLPATVAASFAFMLPVATPPNAIIYECKMIRLREMVGVGIGMNIICIAVTMFCINTYVSAIFHLDKYPVWAVTSLANNSCLLY